MPQNNEQFRNELAARLLSALPQDQAAAALTAFDQTAASYDITRKSTELALVTGFPELAKLYIGAKAVESLSKGTLKQYRYKLADFFDSVRKTPMDVTPNDIRMYLYHFKTNRNASDRYLESVRITINGFFAWLLKNEYILRNPCANIEKIRFNPKRREPLSPFELEVFRWNTQDVREKALIDFFFSTGCRVSECADVRLSDIDWQSRSVLIRHGKGDKERIVYFNAEAEVSLREYLKRRKFESDALFASGRAPHQALGAHTLEEILKKASDRAGMHVFPHRLRHTFATAGLRGGMSLERLQALMGHAKPETTLIYAKQDQIDLQREHQRVYA